MTRALNKFFIGGLLSVTVLAFIFLMVVLPGDRPWLTVVALSGVFILQSSVAFILNAALGATKKTIREDRRRAASFLANPAIRGAMQLIGDAPMESKREEDQIAAAQMVAERLIAGLHNRVETATREANARAEGWGTDKETLETIKREVGTLCSISTPLAIADEWSTRIQGQWDRLSNETIGSLEVIKGMQTSSSAFVEEVEREVLIRLDTSRSHEERYREGFHAYAGRVQTIKESYVRDIEKSTSQIKHSFSVLNQIVDIVERIKLISLNMSIEASKVKQGNAFGLLARELRALADHTEDTIKSMVAGIQTTLGEVESNRAKQTSEFADIIDAVERFRILSEEYGGTADELTRYMKRAIGEIEANQGKQKEVLLSFFKSLQEVAIRKEELNHVILYQNRFLSRAFGVLHQLHETVPSFNDGSCPDEDLGLDELAAVVTTDNERIFVNELFKRIRGVDREILHGAIPEAINGVLLF